MKNKTESPLFFIYSLLYGLESFQHNRSLRVGQKIHGARQLRWSQFMRSFSKSKSILYKKYRYKLQVFIKTSDFAIFLSRCFLRSDLWKKEWSQMKQERGFILKCIILKCLFKGSFYISYGWKRLFSLTYSRSNTSPS